MRRHEVRDEDGHLVAVIEVVSHTPIGGTSTVEMSIDSAGASYRVRLFNPAIAAARRAA